RPNEPHTHLCKESTMTTQTDGRVRKSLAEQIDRLDGILDGLSEALNESVAAAVQEAVGLAVREAVRGVIKEVLTNPDFLAAPRAAVPPAGAANARPQPAVPAEPARPGLLSRAVGGVCGWVKGCARQAWGACAGVAGAVRALTAGVLGWWPLVREFRGHLL